MNIRLKTDYLGDVVKTVLEQGENYGRSDSGAGEKSPSRIRFCQSDGRLASWPCTRGIPR